jgi:hypothetical protein
VQLVLRRSRRRRSLFVWTSGDGSSAIYWRTQKTMAAARPGLKVPAARGLDAGLAVAVDQRERYAWKFTGQRADLSRRELPTGDYGVFAGQHLVAAIERKSPANLVHDAVGGTLDLALADLEQLPRACLIVEGRLSDVLRSAEGRVKTDWLVSVLAALQVAHPRVPWVFAENRALAEAYAYRWLGAALRRWREEMGLAPGLASGPAATTAPATQLRLLEDAGAYAVHDRAGRRAEAARLAAQGTVWTAATFAARFGVSVHTARLDLAEMVAAGLLTASGGRKNRHYLAAGLPAPPTGTP